MLLSPHQLELSSAPERIQGTARGKTSRKPNFGAPPLCEEGAPLLPAEDPSVLLKYPGCRFPNPSGASSRILL